MFYWESSACTSPSANLTALTRMERGGFSQPFSQRRSLIDLSSLTCTDPTFMCFMIKILTSVTALLALFQVGTFLTALSGIVYICSFTKSSAIFLFHRPRLFHIQVSPSPVPASRMTYYLPVSFHNNPHWNACVLFVRLCQAHLLSFHVMTQVDHTCLSVSNLSL
jgi:hypothetical protein